MAPREVKTAVLMPASADASPAGVAWPAALRHGLSVRAELSASTLVLALDESYKSGHVLKVLPPVPTGDEPAYALGQVLRAEGFTGEPDLPLFDIDDVDGLEAVESYTPGHPEHESTLAVAVPDATVDLKVEEHADDVGVFIRSVECTDTHDEGFALYLGVPDFTPATDPITGTSAGWETADRNRYLAWIGLTPA